MTGNTDDAAELLPRLADGPALPEARQYLSSKADSLRQIDQTHRFYPGLRYFHYREPHYALPRILLTTLDSATPLALSRIKVLGYRQNGICGLNWLPRSKKW